MKLTDIIFRLGHYYRGAENFIRHPVEILAQRGRREAQHRLEEIEIPMGRETPRSAPSRQVDRAEREEHWQNPPERDVRRFQARTATAAPTPVSARSRPLPTPLPTRSTRSTEIPFLSEQDQIRGRWGRYRRVGDVLQTGERVRCYNGILALNNKPVLIKEYLLLEGDFNAREIRDRKEKFTTLANLNLRNGGGQDFRLVNLYEAIASPNSTENRCYLISEPIPKSQTLRQYLAATPTVTPRQVRHVLAQVLQTLWFLHQQKVRLPTGEVQYGLPHGNLSLNSLLIAPQSSTEQLTPENELQFFIYVTDLALWEHLFLPASAKVATPTLAGDLVDLGYLGFDLLTGMANATRPNLLLEQPWASVADQPLKQFIRQLVSGKFKANAEEARQVLLGLPWQEASEQGEPLATEQATSSETRHRFLRQLLLLGLLGGCLGGLLWIGGRWFVGRSPNATDPTRPCCLAAITSLPDQPTSYVIEAGGIWDRVLRSQHSIALSRTLEQTLQERDARLKQYTLQTTQEDVISVLRSKSAAFALTEWRTDLPEGFEQQEVAYDGLVAVVAFSDGNPSNGNATLLKGIPEQLEGRITVEQLRQLYTGHVTPQDLADRLEGWSLKLYRPADQATIQQFEQTVLQGDRTTIQQFRERAIAPLPVNQMFSEILKDFEQRHTVGIGFARLSQVINQCSVYPLALGENGKEVQPLMQQQGVPINPATDLCGDKGSYTSNANVFSSSRGFLQNQYPLRYRLVVVYPKGSQAGRSFAETLRTDEGQALLNAAGLVPIRALSDR
ncbi:MULTISPECIES: hypothetical protein [unclassified Leptolyngbya]|uniref:hypothetical protein n=1 Tax=unclassified Leptolyngbya TaxID=2650499 RepID=UPI001688DEC3|nr:MULTISPECIES: hypothetical protein [unclassified Leptolyngbya]MBD1909754.1 hypothetical protein [Leptolyngbya sp. FACHB-8]MBD2157652.1 hypothetical protein [Leptolyngbya sp. FACHB-16]